MSTSPKAAFADAVALVALAMDDPPGFAVVLRDAVRDPEAAGALITALVVLAQRIGTERSELPLRDWLRLAAVELAMRPENPEQGGRPETR